MIISSLYQYYQIMISDPKSDIPLPGFCEANVSCALNLSPDGDVLEVIPLYHQEGKKRIPKRIQVPARKDPRSYNIIADFLYGNSQYVLGITNDEDPERVKRAKDCYEEMKRFHINLLEGVEDAGAEAVLRYFKKNTPDILINNTKISPYLDDLKTASNIVFMLDGDKSFIHQRELLKKVWLDYLNANISTNYSQCLITGEIQPIARTHPEIKGVRGANPRGASLVSFNQEAFTSYGKDQSFNAPVSEEAAFGYTTSLNYLLNNQGRRILLGDATVTFWAMKPKASLEETLLAELINPTFVKEQRKNKNKQVDETLTEDTATVRLIRDILRCVREGRSIREGVTEIDPEVNFCILGLSPNNARLAVRFFHMDSFGRIVERIAQHHTDISIYRAGRVEDEMIRIDRILRETAPQGKEDNIPPLLGGSLMRAVLMGLPYPDDLYHALLGRIRADQDDEARKIWKLNHVRAGLIKGYLLRKARWQKKKDLEVIPTMALNEKTTNTAYLLGRLFALLEKAQKDAAGTELNATIKDRYFGAASATPKAVFPLLMRLAQHHLAKAESGRYRDKQIEEVLGKIESFPAYLNLEEQGLFVLGYYHQREALYTKKEEREG